MSSGPLLTYSHLVRPGQGVPGGGAQGHKDEFGSWVCYWTHYPFLHRYMRVKQHPREARLSRCLGDIFVSMGQEVEPCHTVSNAQHTWSLGNDYNFEAKGFLLSTTVHVMDS